jgi:hypothetical protein
LVFFAGYNAQGNDFYEPRVSGRVFKTSQRFRYNAWFNTNRSKKYSMYGDISVGFLSLFKGRSYAFNIDNNYRFNDKFALGHSLILEPFYNNAGFADITGNDVIFSRRDRNTVENTLTAKYNFNKLNGITFRVRHYWSKVKSKEFYTLKTNGYLEKNTVYGGNVNQNFNAFNIDMVYTWQFAPGSFVNIVYKNAIYEGNQDIDSNYFKNFNNTISSSQNNNLSLKIIYYLDYLQLKRKK